MHKSRGTPPHLYTDSINDGQPGSSNPSKHFRIEQSECLILLLVAEIHRNQKITSSVFG